MGSTLAPAELVEVIATQGFYQYVLRAVRYSYVLVQAVQYQPQGSTR